MPPPPALPTAVGASLKTFLDHLDRTALTDLRADYVATFDHRKRFSPYLTYFAYEAPANVAWRYCGSNTPTAPPD